MRKIISVILVALMLFSVAAVSVSAADCDCANHDGTETCRCCYFCPTMDSTYVMSCAKDGNGVRTGIVCCKDCKGYYVEGGSCGCDCSCCGGTKTPPTNGFDLSGLITEEDKENFVDGFQAVLAKIAAVFNKIFDAIFEFLRIDDVLPGIRG